MPTESATDQAIKPTVSSWLSLSAAARLCPSTREDKPVHPATLSRWISKGVRLQNGVPLRLVAKRFPGGWAVTAQALNEFIDALTADRCGEPIVVEAYSQSTRRREVERADRELAKHG